MNEMIKSPTPIPEDTGFTVFLAGPMKGAPKWQRTVPKLAAGLGIDGVTFLNPYRCQRWVIIARKWIGNKRTMSENAF